MPIIAERMPSDQLKVTFILPSEPADPPPAWTAGPAEQYADAKVVVYSVDSPPPDEAAVRRAIRYLVASGT